MGLGFVLELAGGEEQYQQEPDVELFCFQKLPNKPSAFPPSPLLPQVERCLCVCRRVAVKAKEGKVLKESGRSGQGAGSWPGAGAGGPGTQGLLSVGPGKGGWCL